MQQKPRYYNETMFGHRILSQPDAVAERLHRHLCEILTARPDVCFILGCKGQCDEIAIREVHRAAQTTGRRPAKIVLALPYRIPEYRSNPRAFAAQYDCVWLAGGDYPTAYERRTQTMLDHANYAIFAVDHPSGGAYTAMWYADAHRVPYVNLLDGASVTPQPVDIDAAVAD